MATQRVSRRRFIGRGGAAAALTAAGWSRAYGANERLRVAAVGVGGKGWSDLTGVAASPKVEIVALCDIDETKRHLGRAAERFAAAKAFTDWRRLMEAGKSFDAVTISTPDHMHAPVCLPALALGKHVFCQKPLAHTVFEVRQLRMAAKEAGTVTQMGNQIHSHTHYRTAVKLVRDGAIGKVKEVHSWQAGAMSWLLADDRPAGADPVPAGVHWDEWLGVAAERPYKDKLYHSFNWRGWQAFSNGQLGDFGCHVLDPVFSALDLTAPTYVRGEAPPMNAEVWNKWSVVAYDFPGTAFTANRRLPLTWYDGEGKLPPVEALGLPKAFKLPQSGSLFVGLRGSMLLPHVGTPQLLPEEQYADFKFEKLPSIDHYTSWADACRGEGTPGSPFSYAAGLTEAVLLGAIAVRAPVENLAWVAERLAIPNSKVGQSLVSKAYRKGWEPTWLPLPLVRPAPPLRTPRSEDPE